VREQVQESVNDLESSLTSAISSGNISQATTELRDAAQNVKDDVSDAKEKANCN
jgi:hypothetical protein